MLISNIMKTHFICICNAIDCQVIETKIFFFKSHITVAILDAILNIVASPRVTLHSPEYYAYA